MHMPHPSQQAFHLFFCFQLYNFCFFLIFCLNHPSMHLSQYIHKCTQHIIIQHTTHFHILLQRRYSLYKIYSPSILCFCIQSRDRPFGHLVLPPADKGVKNSNNNKYTARKEFSSHTLYFTYIPSSHIYYFFTCYTFPNTYIHTYMHICVPVLTFSIYACV